jgi:TPR repeat protein
MQKEQVKKCTRCCVVAFAALLVMDCFADAKVSPPTRELSEIEKTMSRALEFEMIRNGELAGKWYKKASDLGSIAARCQFLAGTLNDPSECDTVTEEECDEAFRRANAAKGTPEGMYALANCYVVGVGVEEDRLKADEWMKKSAAANYAPALAFYAFKQMHGGFGHGTTRWTDAQILDGFRRAYENGSPVGAAFWAAQSWGGDDISAQMDALKWAAGNDSIMGNMFLSRVYMGMPLGMPGPGSRRAPPMDLAAARRHVEAAEKLGLDKQEVELCRKHIAQLERQISEQKGEKEKKADKAEAGDKPEATSVGAAPFDADTFIQRALEVTPSTPKDEMDSLDKAVRVNGKAVADAVAVRLADKSAKEDDKVKYVWLLGLAKQDSSVPLMLDVFKTSNPTSLLHMVTSRALVEIGGDEVGALFLENYRKNKAKMGEERKFDAMQELAMLQYAPAVKDAEEFLKIDPERYYWQVYFIFGLFDDLAVPMLCEKLNDSDALVRTNALGAIRFLMPESKDMTKALLKRLEVEKDPSIRYQLVETIEWNMIAQGKKGQQELRETFSRLLKSEDKDSFAAKFMRETVASKSAMPAGMREKFKPDANKFNAAYKTILDNGVHLSYGQEAANDILYCATRKDVPKLKELRRRALYRQSDECFYDHKKLTRIINWVLACAPEAAP